MLKSLITEIFGVGPHPEETIDATDLRGDAPARHEREQRLVVIFSDTSGVMADAQLQSLMAHRDALQEREIAVVRIDGDEVHHAFGSLAASSSETTMSREDLVPSLRQEVTVTSGNFGLVLVGKDGHVKSRYSAPVAPATLFAEIDAMPMRQSELQKAELQKAELQRAQLQKAEIHR